MPNVTRKEYTLVDISDDGFLSLMDDSGETREDVKLPDGDLAFDIKGKFENESDKEWIILVLGAMGHEQVIQIKAGTALKRELKDKQLEEAKAKSDPAKKTEQGQKTKEENLKKLSAVIGLILEQASEKIRRETSSVAGAELMVQQRLAELQEELTAMIDDVECQFVGGMELRRALWLLH